MNAYCFAVCIRFLLRKNKRTNSAGIADIYAERKYSETGLKPKGDCDVKLLIDNGFTPITSQKQD